MTAPEVELRTTWHHIASTGHDSILDSLVARHRESHRRYHTLTHVIWVLRHVSALAHAGESTTDLAAVQFAALWHDAVYTPGANDNEACSAVLACCAAADLGWETPRQLLVERLVLATAEHRPYDADEALLVDADLAILGAPRQVYANYVTGIRHEYSHVDDGAWKLGRTAVLTSFLTQPHLYFTDTMRTQRETRARANIADELASLSGQ